MRTSQAPSSIGLIILLCSTLLLQCNPFQKDKEENNDGALALLALLANAGLPPAKEPRPFRGRSFAVSPNGTEVYDWNNETAISSIPEITATVGNLTESDAGRFSYANVNNVQFRVLDSGINLSPHGDHYHVDKANPILISTSRLNLQLGTPRSVTSKNGRAAFAFTNGTVRLLEEKNLVGQANPTLISLSNAPTDGANTSVLWLNIAKGIGVEGSTFKFYSNVNTGALENPSPPACLSPGFPATHQTPITGQSFADLNAEFAYNHTVVYPCNDGALVIRHADSNNTGAGSYSFSLVSLARRTANWQALFKNNNYSVFGRNTRPIFFGNFGTNEETSLLRLDGSTGIISSLSVPSYRGRNFAVEQMLGKQVAILRNDGQISIFDADTLTLIRDLRILPNNTILSGDNAPRMYSTWSAALVHYKVESGESFLQEINLEEALPTRRIQIPSTVSSFSFHLARMKGADYEGPAHQ